VGLDTSQRSVAITRTSQFITQSKGNISHSIKTPRIIVFEAAMCKSPDVPLQDELLC